MNKLILSLILLMATSTIVYAQDVLVTEGGDAIKAWGVDVGGTKIYYRTDEAEESPTQSIAKAKVLVWKKADGTRVFIGQEDTTQPQTAQPSQQKTLNSTTPTVDATDSEANSMAIAAFNRSYISSLKEPSNSKAWEVFGIFHMTPGSVIADKNVEILFKSGEEVYKPQNISITLRNKTDQTIYIYLGNTFFLRQDVAFPFNTSSASQAVGNGMAAAATGFSQSVIAVPAGSSFDLGEQPVASVESKNAFSLPIRAEEVAAFEPTGLFAGKTHKYYALQWWASKYEMVKKGEIRTFLPENSPLKFGFKLTYSFSESNTQFYHLDAQMYLSKIVGCKYLNQVEKIDAPLSIHMLQFKMAH